MRFESERIYHIYNRGNNRQRIFFNRENYLYFLRKIRDKLKPHCDIMAYCLMPNHFHLMIKTNEKSVKTIFVGKDERNVLSEAMRQILSSYSFAVNKQERRTGSLFTQNTNAKELASLEIDFETTLTCFNYIHQNPYVALFVDKIEDWEFSSFRDYAGLRDGTLCNKELTKRILNINQETFYEDSYQVLNQENLSNIWLK
ncbi:MAG: transposase [Spirosomataceae bacterium]